MSQGRGVEKATNKEKKNYLNEQVYSRMMRGRLKKIRRKKKRKRSRRKNVSRKGKGSV